MIFKKHIALFTILFSISFCNFSQTQLAYYPNYSTKPNIDYFKSYLTVSKNIVTGPAHWKKKQWIAAAAIVSTTATVYFFDDDIRKFFQKNKTDNLDFASKYIFEPWGSGVYPAIFFGSYYIYGLAAKNNKAKQIALGGTQAFFMAALSSQVLKHIFHRHRPNQNNPPDPFLWDGPIKGWQHTSFPSGHTTAAFAIASFMQKVYSDKIWVGIVSYSLATGVGLSRVYDNKHWPTDVIIGAALGFAIGQTVFQNMTKDTKLSLGFSSNGGVKLAYRID